MPFPGLNIDNVPFFAAIAASAQGQTLIHDWVYDNRAIYLTDLNRLGAQVKLLDPHRVLVDGTTRWRSAEMMCPPALRPAVVVLGHDGRRGHLRTPQRLRHQPRLRGLGGTPQLDRGTDRDLPGHLRGGCRRALLTCVNTGQEGCGGISGTSLGLCARTELLPVGLRLREDRVDGGAAARGVLLPSVLLWQQSCSAGEAVPLFFPEAPCVQPLDVADDVLASWIAELLSDLDAGLSHRSGRIRPLPSASRGWRPRATAHPYRAIGRSTRRGPRARIRTGARRVTGSRPSRRSAPSVRGSAGHPPSAPPALPDGRSAPRRS